VQDNLNTHNASSFYEQLPADEAFALAQRFTFHYTPKSASWLNMIEIEFSALARQCLHRRIPTLEQLERASTRPDPAASRPTPYPALAIQGRDRRGAAHRARHDRRLTLPWQFSFPTARDKLNRHYARVQADNRKFKYS